MFSKAVDSKVVRKYPYSYYNPRLNDAAYATGDVYSKDKIAASQEQWMIRPEIPPKPQVQRPYLEHIKNLSTSWPHLRLLADFMEIGTTPLRWTDFHTEKRSQAERDERISRTEVTRLDYFTTGDPVSRPCKTPDELSAALTEQDLVTDPPNPRTFRLFVVEDLSRDVIERLGAHFDIEPAFFREQIFDYAWYNTRDRWIDTPCVDIAGAKKRWIQLRFATARYFTTPDDFTEGAKQFDDFNVYRRAEDDQNNKARWDEVGAIVGLTRTRVSFWVGGKGAEEGKIGVLLLDPAIEAGVPLWHGYRNWEDTPGMHDQIPQGPPRDSIYSDFLYWAKKPDAFKASSPSNTVTITAALIPMQALLYLVCAEWLMLSEYIRTRVGQIEWEISFPEHFISKGSSIDVALKKLHIWRRLMPLYREMLTETLQRLENFPIHNPGIFQAGNVLGNTPATTGPPPAPASNADSSSKTISALSTSFTHILTSLHEYQARIDRLTSVVTAIISIDDSRRSRDDNRNVSRLTWLAFFFIPLSFVASLFSMQTDLSGLNRTVKIYCTAALPVAAGSVALALLLGLPAVQKLLEGFVAWIEGLSWGNRTANK